jgi:hypothetical protein
MKTGPQFILEAIGILTFLMMTMLLVAFGTLMTPMMMDMMGIMRTIR